MLVTVRFITLAGPSLEKKRITKSSYLVSVPLFLIRQRNVYLKIVVIIV